MNSQFKKGVIELCVLAFIEKDDCYGYQLVSSISKNIEISEGTIYPLLRRLKNDGLVNTYLKESSEGPPRKYYALTEEGKKNLSKTKKEWIDFIKGVDNIIKDGEEDE